MLVDMSPSDKLLAAVEMNLRLTDAERDEVIELCKKRGYHDSRTGKVGPVAFVLFGEEVIAKRAEGKGA